MQSPHRTAGAGTGLVPTSSLITSLPHLSLPPSYSLPRLPDLPPCLEANALSSALDVGSGSKRPRDAPSYPLLHAASPPHPPHPPNPLAISRAPLAPLPLLTLPPPLPPCIISPPPPSAVKPRLSSRFAEKFPPTAAAAAAAAAGGAEVKQLLCLPPLLTDPSLLKSESRGGERRRAAMPPLGQLGFKRRITRKEASLAAAEGGRGSEDVLERGEGASECQDKEGDFDGSHAMMKDMAEIVEEDGGEEQQEEAGGQEDGSEWFWSEREQDDETLFCEAEKAINECHIPPLLLPPLHCASPSPAHRPPLSGITSEHRIGSPLIDSHSLCYEPPRLVVDADLARNFNLPLPQPTPKPLPPPALLLSPTPPHRASSASRIPLLHLPPSTNPAPSLLSSPPLLSPNMPIPSTSTKRRSSSPPLHDFALPPPALPPPSSLAPSSLRLSSAFPSSSRHPLSPSTAPVSPHPAVHSTELAASSAPVDPPFLSLSGSPQKRRAARQEREEAAGTSQGREEGGTVEQTLQQRGRGGREESFMLAAPSLSTEALSSPLLSTNARSSPLSTTRRMLPGKRQLSSMSPSCSSPKSSPTIQPAPISRLSSMAGPSPSTAPLAPPAITPHVVEEESSSNNGERGDSQVTHEPSSPHFVIGSPSEMCSLLKLHGPKLLREVLPGGKERLRVGEVGPGLASLKETLAVASMRWSSESKQATNSDPRPLLESSLFLPASPAPA